MWLLTSPVRILSTKEFVRMSHLFTAQQPGGPGGRQKLTHSGALSRSRPQHGRGLPTPDSNLCSSSRMLCQPVTLLQLPLFSTQAATSPWLPLRSGHQQYIFTCHSFYFSGWWINNLPSVQINDFSSRAVIVQICSFHYIWYHYLPQWMAIWSFHKKEQSLTY